jgi:hypothetical protein
MNEVSNPGERHPAGEGGFTFPTAGGRVRLSVTEDALTPFGGLVPWAAYTKHIGIAREAGGGLPGEADQPERRASV